MHSREGGLAVLGKMNISYYNTGGIKAKHRLRKAEVKTSSSHFASGDFAYHLPPPTSCPASNHRNLWLGSPHGVEQSCACASPHERWKYVSFVCVCRHTHDQVTQEQKHPGYNLLQPACTSCFRETIWRNIGIGLSRAHSSLAAEIPGKRWYLHFL